LIRTVGPSVGLALLVLARTLRTLIDALNQPDPDQTLDTASDG
jgi:hypothetical protein